MTNLRNMILKKGGHAKTPTTLRGDLKKMVGTYTHKSMDDEPSYKKLHAKTRQIRVGEPRKLTKPEVEKETPYKDRVLHEKGGHSSHNKPKLGVHDNRIGLKKGGHCRAEGGEADVAEEANEARKGGHMKRKHREGGGLLGELTGGLLKKGGKAKRHAEGGEATAKRGGTPHRDFGGLLSKIADYNPIAALASGRGFGGAAQSLGNAAGVVAPFLKEGGEAKRGGRMRSDGGALQGHRYGKKELNMKRPDARARHLEGYRSEGGEAKCEGGKMSDGGDAPKAKGGKWIQDMHMKKGKLHRELGVPAGEKIPGKKLMRAEHSRNPTIRKEANLAKTLRSFHPKGRS